MNYRIRGIRESKELPNTFLIAPGFRDNDQKLPIPKTVLYFFSHPPT